MAPKQVYGKRSAKATANYARFLTPEKPDGFVLDKQAKNANERIPKEDPIDHLEKELEAFSIREDVQVADEKTKRKRRGRPRKGTKEGDDKTKTKNTTSTAHEQAEESQRHSEAMQAPVTPVRTRKSTSRPKSKPAPTPNMPRLPTPEPTPEPDDVHHSYVASLLRQSYGRKIIPYDQWSTDLEPHFEVTKIAEASFSEVYRLTATTSSLRSANESVLKLVALKMPVNAPLPSQCQVRAVRDPERQAKKGQDEREEHNLWKSDVDDVLSEVKLLQNLNHIPGFTNFRELTLLQGRPSAAFARAWEAWNKSRPKGRKSQFPNPGKKTSYEDTQLWAVIEMQDAGTDCEKLMEAGGLSTIWEVWDVFWGVCLSVAKAEEACKFEHRDLHLENICIRSSRPDGDMTRPLIKGPLKRKLGFSGLDTTVIDYTLSRAEMLRPEPHSRPSSPSCDSDSPTHSNPSIAYLDLNKDEGLFNGDASQEYQYEIYRYMRGAACYNNPLAPAPCFPPTTDPTPSSRHLDEDLAHTAPRRSPRKHDSNRYGAPPPDIWARFHPKTNLVWAHFILYRLLEHLQYHEYAPAELSKCRLLTNVVDVGGEDVGRVRKKAGRLLRVLEKVSGMLDPRVLGREESLGSMKELVVLGMESRWLGVEDVAGGED